MPETVVIDGEKYVIPDGMTALDVYDKLKGTSSGTSGGSNYSYSQRPSSGSFFGSIDPDTLEKDKDWLHATNEIYKSRYGRDFEGSKADLAEYGLDMMGWFNHNSVAMTVDAARMQSASPEARKAFLYLMNTYDDLQFSWSGAGRFIKGQATDPLNWTGLLSLGIGTAETQAGKLAGKELVSSMLKEGIKAGGLGAAQSTIGDAARQSVEISGGAKDSFSYGELAGQAALGAGLGGVLGAATEGVSNVFRTPLSKGVGEVAGEVTPPAAPTPVVPEKPVVPASTENAEQLNLNLGDMNNPEAAAQTRMDRLALSGQVGVPEAATEPSLPMEMPFERRLDELPSFAQPQPKETMGEMETRLMEKWGVDHQLKMDLGEPKEAPYAYDGQGNLFSKEGLPVDKIGPNVPKEGLGATEKAVQAEGEKAAANVASAVAEAPKGSNLEKALSIVKDLAFKNEGNAGQAIIDLIKKGFDPEGWKISPGGRTQFSEQAKEAIDLLASLKVDSINDAEKVLDSAALSQPQAQALVQTVAEASDKMTSGLRNLIIAERSTTDGAERAFLRTQIAKLQTAQDALAKIDMAASSGSGAELGSRVGKMLVGDRRINYSVQEIMRKNPTLTERQAQDAFVEQFANVAAKIEENDALKDLTSKINAAFDAGEWDKVESLGLQRIAMREMLAKDQGINPSLWKKLNNILNEYVIGTVFTVKTAVANTIPSALKLLYKPTMNYLADHNASIGSIGASYSAMFSGGRAAIEYAASVFKYEHNPFFGKNSDFLGYEPSIPGKLGRLIRFFPRVLEATDAMFAQMHYRGFVAQEVFNQAASEAEKMGLKGAEWDNHVNGAVKTAIDNMFASHVDHEAALDMLLQQGLARGYRGEKLQWFVKTGMQDQNFLARPTSVVGRSYAEDVLFKRSFAGNENSDAYARTASNMAIAYEKFMNSSAINRIAFQLFVRTPIRVFEEGIRLTPGLNLVAPKFMSDLTGANGVQRQIRAQGEAIMSLAFGAAAMSMYANGMITGGGPSNFRQRQGKENVGDWQPYTIYLPGGKSFSFRNLDPFATPLKMIVNAMDKLQEYEYRSAQGEYSSDVTKETAAIVGLALSPVIQSVKDANLTDGLDQITNLIKMLYDPVNNEGALTNYLTSKAKLLVPNMIGSTVGLVEGLRGQPIALSNPATMGQAISTRFDPNTTDVPAQRDALGLKRYMGNPVPAFFGIGVDNLMNRKITPEQKAVLKELSDIETANNVSFVLPAKIPSLDPRDLRTIYMPDGKTTWYDRIYDLYANSGVDKTLYTALITHKDQLSYGTPSAKGTKYDTANTIIQHYRELAIAQFQAEYQKARQSQMMVDQKKAFGKFGALDVPNVPQY